MHKRLIPQLTSKRSHTLAINLNQLNQFVKLKIWNLKTKFPFLSPSLTQKPNDHNDDPQVTEDEIRTIAGKIVNDPDYFQQNGIMLGAEKYICISAEKNLVRGRKNKNALCIVATATCK